MSDYDNYEELTSCPIHGTRIPFFTDCPDCINEENKRDQECQEWEAAAYQERERVRVADYQIMPSDEACPLCGAALESLVDMESATLDGERCTREGCTFDNLFVNGAQWPETEPEYHDPHDDLHASAHHHPDCQCNYCTYGPEALPASEY